MGVVNVTPDSFSDGGRCLAPHAAIDRAHELVAQGADIIDCGAESTRPGAMEVSAAEEWARLAPVVAALAGQLGVPLSIDTRKGSVARAALAAGAELINDISGGQDPNLLDAVAQADVPLVLGHLRGTPRAMQEHIAFVDVCSEVAAELAAAVARARQAGVRQIIVDPGIGFGKRTTHNLTLLAHAGALSAELDLPLLVGPSRKAFLGELTGRPPEGRLPATLGAVVAAVLHGAQLVRVHDVAAARDALTVAHAIRGSVAPPPASRVPGGHP